MTEGSASAPDHPQLSVFSRLRSNLFQLPLFVLLTTVFGCVSLVMSLFERDGRRQHAIAHWWGKASLWAAGARATVLGRENQLPLAIYASNHASFMDTPLVFSSLPFQFRILAKQGLWKWPFIGWHLHRSGQIPIDEANHASAVAGLNRAIRAIKSGMPLFLFPEGGRTRDGSIQDFMNGAAYIAIRARAPLIPVALIGTFQLLPIETHHFRPRAVSIVFGLPIDPAGYSIRQTEELTRRLRTEIAALYQQHSLERFPDVRSTAHFEAGES